MATSYFNQGAGYLAGTEIDQGAYQNSAAPSDSTTVGVATATKNGTSKINVGMPYTDDNNANNTYTVDYKLSSAGGWTNWVTGAGHTASPYTTIITGLNAGGKYDVKCTYIDSDGVTGTNPQTISNIQLDNPLNGTNIIMMII